jgi:hypothetical protein
MRLDIAAAQHQLKQVPPEVPDLPNVLNKAVECVSLLTEVMEGVGEEDGMVRRAPHPALRSPCPPPLACHLQPCS